MISEEELARLEGNNCSWARYSGGRNEYSPVEPKRAAAEIRSLRARVEGLEKALASSVELQSHYAALLNQYDGGARKTFTAEQWIERLASL